MVLVAAITLAWVISGRPSAHTVDPSFDLSPTTAPRTSTPTAHRTVVVDVAGKVRRPGVYELPDGSRVIDALRKAGGALPGVPLTSVNLAAKLADGQQIVVGVAGAAPAPAAGGSAGATGPVSLNTATLEQLDALPGVGPVLAQNILDFRTAHGHFDRIEQLNDVTGIGPAKFASLKDLVTV